MEASHIRGKHEGREGFTHIGSLIYTAKPSKDGSAGKVGISASVRSSRNFRKVEEDGPPEWMQQLELLTRLEGAHNDSDVDGDELPCRAMQLEEVPDWGGLSSGGAQEEEEEEMIGGPVEASPPLQQQENVEGVNGPQEKQDLVEDGDEEYYEHGEEMEDKEMSRKGMGDTECYEHGEEMKDIERPRAGMESIMGMENIEMSRKEMEDIEVSRRHYFAALIAAKEKPGEETLALAAGLRVRLEKFLAIPSFSSFAH